MLIAPQRHTSIIFCDRIKENWTDFRMYGISRGFENVTQHINTVLLEDYNNNYSKYMGKKKPDVYIDYRNDSMETIISKMKYFTDGQLYDDFKAISTSRVVLSKEMKNRGMKY